MSRIILLFLWVLANSFIFIDVAYSQPTSFTKVDKEQILIVYLSRTQNTKAVAQMIHNQVGGDMIDLQLVTPYPKNYQQTVEQVRQEDATGFLPALTNNINNIQQYNVIFIGFPTWGMQLPPPIKTFLHQYNLKGKTVIPFNTNAGYGVGQSFEQVKVLCIQCHVLEGFSTHGGVEKDGKFLMIKDKRADDVKQHVTLWLQKLGFSSISSS
ncbi:Flavodoxin [Candidatus Hepatincola sp. Pdp]